MRRNARWLLLTAPWLIGLMARDSRADAPKVYPAAVFPIEERGAGVKDYGAKVGGILFAALVADPGVVLVEREELQKILEEQGLNLSGAVKPSEATRIGQLTGARVLVTGSVFQVDKTIYLVVKLIGTETSRVIGVSVKGKAGDDIGPLAEGLASKVADAIQSRGETLVAPAIPKEDRIAALKQELGESARPKLWISVTERHVGQPTIDPAAATELALIAKKAGFEVIDDGQGTQGQADVIVSGEGFSEFAGRVGGLVAVKARLEVKAVDRKTGRLLAVDRQTVRLVDLTEQVGGKTALQEAAAEIAARVLPKLAKD